MKWHGLIGLAYPGLKNRTIDCQLMSIIGRAYDNRAKIVAGSIDVGPHQCAGLLQYIEYCSGAAKLSKKLIQHGLRGCSLDIAYTADHSHNMLVDGKRLEIVSGCNHSVSKQGFALVGYPMQLFCHFVLI